MGSAGPAGETCGGKAGGAATDVGGLEVAVAAVEEDEEEDVEGLEAVGSAPVWHWMTGGCWACRCCWADESESLSLSRGLGMLGDELRLSWSMSLGSLLPSSFTLRPSELSPSPSPSNSDGESGRPSSWRGKAEETTVSNSSSMRNTYHSQLHTLHPQQPQLLSMIFEKMCLP